VTIKKLKSSFPVAKENVWITFALENVSLTSSAAVSEKKSKVNTLSLIVNARHFLVGCTQHACMFLLLNYQSHIYFLLLNGKVNLEGVHTLIELFIVHVNYGELSRLKQHQRV
jgi:hypothetical protein